jgi:hypothetical protein
MAYSWSKGARSRAKARYRTRDPMSHEIMKNRTALNQQYQSYKNTIFKIAEQVAEIIEKNDSDKFLKNLEKKKKEIYKKNKEAAIELSKKLRGFSQVGLHPIKSSINKAQKKAAEMYYSQGTSLDNLDSAKKSHFVHGFAKAAEVATNYVKSAANFAYNRHVTLQEDYITSQMKSNVEDSVNRVKGLAQNVWDGAKDGAKVGGVVGAIIGGVAGAIDYGSQQYIEYQQRMSNYYQQLNATNFQTNFDASRLGLIGSSGTEN